MIKRLLYLLSFTVFIPLFFFCIILLFIRLPFILAYHYIILGKGEYELGLIAERPIMWFGELHDNFKIKFAY